MSQASDWLNPTNNGFLRVEKPPLLYWLLLISSSAFGLNEFALRLPTALAISGWVIATYLIMRRINGELFGVIAATILGTSLGIRIFAETLQPEPFLALFSTLCLWCIIEARFALVSSADVTGSPPSLPPAAWYQLFWVFLALGLLSKGLHGAGWPLGGVLLTALFFPSTRPWLKGVASFQGFMLFLIIATPWYIYMGFRWRGFLVEHFINEQVLASVSHRAPQVNRSFPLIPFHLHQLYALMPWSLAIPAAILELNRGKWLRLSQPAREAVCCLVVTFLLEAASLSFSTRLTYYGVSTWGIAAGFLALPWRRDFLSEHRLGRFLLLLPALGLIAAGGFYVYLTIHYLRYAPAAPSWPLQVSQTRAILLGTIQLSQVPLAWTISLALVLGGAGLAALKFWRDRRSSAMVSAIASAMMVLFIFITVGMGKVATYFSLAGVARTINATQATEPNVCVIFDGDPISASSFLFYLQPSLRYVDANYQNEYAQRVLGLGRNHYLHEEDFVKLWQSSEPLYLVMPKGRAEHWNPVLATPKSVFETGQYRVETNFIPTVAPKPAP